MFGTAEAYALSAEFGSAFSVLRSICVRADGHSLIFIGKMHNSSEVTAVGVCGNGLDGNVVNIAGAAVERNRIALLHHFSIGRCNRLLLFIDGELAAACHTDTCHGKK